MSNRQTSKFSAGIIGTLRRTILIVLAVCLLAGVIPAFDDPSIENPTIIINRAAASYEDQNGTIYTTVSPTVVVTVLAVPAITVTPDETAPSASTAPNERITRQFRICNTGNAPDFFLPLGGTASAPAVINAVYFDADASGTVTPADTPVQFGQTLTPRLASGNCLTVLYVVETNAIAANSELVLTLSARSTLPLPGTNNFAQDAGTITNSVGSGVIFTSPADISLPPVKLVENLPRTVGATGQTLNYTIAFRNGGAAAAREVRVVDDLPVGLEYVGGTLRLNNRSVTDPPDADEGTANARRIEFLIPEIAAGAVTNIQFQARVLSLVSGGGIINFAVISAANAAAVNSSNAVVVVNPVGTVYAGNSGGSAPIAGASVKIAVDESGTPLNLVQNIGYAPNAENVNPFNTDGSGNFSFALAADQIGSSGSPARYLLNVTAPNYRPRLLEATISPNGADGFYRAVIRALDNQPIAVAAGFTLTTTTVELPNLAALVFNIPMFELSTLEITKSADKQIAEIGDIVSYRLQVRNATASVLRAATVRDTLPPSFAYVSGTAQIETGRAAQSIEPQVNGGELVFEIGDLGAASSVTLTYRVRIGANAPEGEQFNVAVAQGTQPNGAIIRTQPAKAGVRVRGGVFSMRQIVIGRVFEDLDGDGQFDAGERPVSGARIYMNNGQSVTTDSAGLYNLPAVGEGSLVISLDPLTVPKNYFLTDDKERRSSKSWTRLLQTPLGGGSLLRQNFAVAPADKGAAVADDQKIIDVNVRTRPQSARNSTDGSKTPLQLASLKNKISLNIPAAGSVENSVSGTRQTDTYNVETTETIAPVAAGNLLVLSPKIDEVIMSPALSINVRVAKDWTIEALVNSEKITSANIGETRVDNRNQVTTFSFVGINLRSGENQIRLTAIGADGVRGKSADLKVFGRGAVDKLEIIPEKNQLQAGGREAVAVEIRAFDQRGNPAQDGQIGIETSAGRFVVKRQPADENAVETAEMPRQISVSLENGKATVYLIGDGAAQLARLKVVAD